MRQVSLEGVQVIGYVQRGQMQGRVRLNRFYWASSHCFVEIPVSFCWSFLSLSLQTLSTNFGQVLYEASSLEPYKKKKIRKYPSASLRLSISPEVEQLLYEMQILSRVMRCELGFAVWTKCADTM
jgi:hypothetical protein